MTYKELENELLYFNHMMWGYLTYRANHKEIDKEKTGIFSGELNEVDARLNHLLTDTKENFELITTFLKEHCPNTFTIMIANLDSNQNKYETLYDLCREINMIAEDNFHFPIDCLKIIRIYYKGEKS